MREHERAMRACVTAALLLCADQAQAALLNVDPSDPAAFKTIADAVAKAEAGDTIMIRAGTYREQIAIKAGKITLQGESGAVIKGSDVVMGWEPLSDGRFVKRGWVHNSQQVFVDGVSQRQVGGTISSEFPSGKWKGRVDGDQNSLREGSFYYDSDATNLYLKPVGGNLNRKTVEVSVRPHFVHAVGVANITLRNLTFTHSNSTAFGQVGALRLIGNNITVNWIKVIDCDGTAMTIRGDNNVVKDSLFTRCGQFGVTGSGRSVKVTGNEISYNNTRGFDKWWGAGGTKFMGAGPLGGVSGLHDSEFTGNVVVGNKGDGIWFDTDNRNNLIKDNVAAYNEGSGIHYEISFGGKIVNNFSFGNTQRGIYIANSADTVAMHNLVACNGLEGIYAVNEAKRAEKYPPRNNKVMENIIAWSGKHAVRLPPADYNNVSDGNLIVGTTLLYGVWDHARNPSVNGLVNWQEQFGQDKNSSERALAMPAELAAKIKNEETNMDWTVLERLASRLESRGMKREPGPRK